MKLRFAQDAVHRKRGEGDVDLAGSLRKAIDIVKLNGPVAAEVARDEQSFGPGLIFVAAAGLAGAIGGLRHGGGGLISGPIAAIIGYFIGVGILHFVATVFFGGKGEYLALFRAESHAAILGWAGIIPFIGWLVGLWHLPVTVVILENVYGMTREKAVLTVVVIVGFFVLLGVVMAMFFAAFFAALFAGLFAIGAH
jgi:hypothetical protein